MKPNFSLLISMLLVLFPLCVQAGEPHVSTFYMIRHAEKELNGNSDPALTAAGKARTATWTESFEKIKLDAVYSTDTTRTLSTAKPIAIDHELNVQLYDPHAIDYEGFIAEHRGQSVLIVGHSNTSPAFANGLLGNDRYAELDESNYGSLFIVDVTDKQRISKLLQINPPGR